MVPCAGKGDKEQAFFFLFVIVGNDGGQHPKRCRTAFPLPAQRKNAGPKRRQMHHAEFETLACVHRHQPNSIDAINRGWGLAQSALITEHFEAANPIEHVALWVAISCGVILNGELQELVYRQSALLVGGRGAP
jgi:hypothetical protein